MSKIGTQCEFLDDTADLVLMCTGPTSSVHSLRIFFTGSQRMGCPILPERFFQQLAHPDPKKQPHPALINAMLLVGVSLTRWTPGYSTAKPHNLPPSTPSSEVLLAKTQAHLQETLNEADRLLDHLQASIMLSYYFFQHGRLQEGQFISASNSRYHRCWFLSQGLLVSPDAPPQDGRILWPASYRSKRLGRDEARSCNPCRTELLGHDATIQTEGHV